MADLVWPSELSSPYQLDGTNSDVQNITSCTYDDGTTVYDIINGGTTTFDAVNQLGTTAPNGERISATWSTGKPTGIDDNPFSLLATAEDKREEYYLEFDGVNQHCTVPTQTFDMALDSFELSFKCEYKSQTKIIVGRDDISNRFVCWRSGGVLRIFGGTTYDTNLGLVDSEVYEIRLVFSGGNLSYYVNDTFHSTITITGSLTFNTVGSWGGSYMFLGAFHYLKVLDHNDNGNNRLYSFNRTQGTTVPDLYGKGGNATLVNFPTDDSQWQRVVEKQVFTVGSGRDYSNIGAFINAHKNDVGTYLVVDVYESTVLGTISTSYFSSIPTLEFNYINPITYSDGQSGNYVATNGYTKTIVKNLNAISTAKQVLGIPADANVEYRNLQLIAHNAGGGIREIGGITGQVVFYDSLIVQKNNDNGLEGGGTVGLYNSIVYNDFEGSKYALADTLNVTSVDSLASGFGTSTTGSHNLSEDDTATTLGIGTQDTNLATYFTDPTNNDYTINQTGQTALQGQGWNGSDIASWAYTDAGGGATYTLNLDTGSITNTGSVANLTQNIKTLINSGAITATGSNLDFSSSKGFLLESETVSVTGSILTIKQSIKTVIESGNILLTGSALNFVHTPGVSSFTFNLDSGAITTSGNGATLAQSLTTPLDSGGHTVNGQVINIGQLYSFAFDTGVINNNLGNLLAPVQYVMMASSGSVTLTGRVMNLTASSDVIQTIDSFSVTYASDIVSINYAQDSFTVSYKG